MIVGGSSRVHAEIGTRYSTPFSLNVPSGIRSYTSTSGLLDLECRIEEGVVLEMEAHRSVRWVLHAVGGSRVTCGNRDIRHLEFRGRGTDARHIAIHRFTESCWNDPRGGRGIGWGHLRTSGKEQQGESAHCSHEMFHRVAS